MKGRTHIRRSQVLAIYAVGASALVVSILALLATQWTMHGQGSIKTAKLGVYWDPECTNPTFSLDFGLLDPGSSKDFILYVRNEGNASLSLSMTSENWNPANAADYISLTWTREGQQINPEGVLDFVITLSVSENSEGIDSFNLDIIISGIS